MSNFTKFVLSSLLIFFTFTVLVSGGYIGYKYYKENIENKDNQEEDIEDEETEDDDVDVEDEDDEDSELSENLESAIEVVQNYMEARMDRDLSEAQPYMTDSLYAEFDQESFAGTSSPSVGGYRAEAEYVELGDLYVVTTEVDWYLQGEKVDTSIWEFQVVFEEGKFLVNQVDMEESSN